MIELQQILLSGVRSFFRKRWFITEDVVKIITTEKSWLYETPGEEGTAKEHLISVFDFSIHNRNTEIALAFKKEFFNEHIEKTRLDNSWLFIRKENQIEYITTLRRLDLYYESFPNSLVAHLDMLFHVEIRGTPYSNYKSSLQVSVIRERQEHTEQIENSLVEAGVFSRPTGEELLSISSNL